MLFWRGTSLGLLQWSDGFIHGKPRKCPLGKGFVTCRIVCDSMLQWSFPIHSFVWESSSSVSGHWILFQGSKLKIQALLTSRSFTQDIGNITHLDFPLQDILLDFHLGKSQDWNLIKMYPGEILRKSKFISGGVIPFFWGGWCVLQQLLQKSWGGVPALQEKIGMGSSPGSGFPCHTGYRCVNHEILHILLLAIQTDWK